MTKVHSIPMLEASQRGRRPIRSQLRPAVVDNITVRALAQPEIMLVFLDLQFQICRPEIQARLLVR